MHGTKSISSFYRKTLFLLSFLTIVFLLALTPRAHAATVTSSSGSTSVQQVNVDFVVTNWDINFSISNGSAGDTISIVTNNITIYTPRNLVASNGQTIGVLEHVSQTDAYPNSNNITNTYRARLTTDVSSASVNLSGSTQLWFHRFIHAGGHDEAVWIDVNGNRVATEWFHIPSCSYDSTDIYASLVSNIYSAHYEGGQVKPYGSATLLHASDHGAQLEVGDIVVWRFNDHSLHMSIASGYSVGSEVVGSGSNPGREPSWVRTIGDYGMEDRSGAVPWKGKLAWCSEYECAMQVTQVGSGGIEWGLGDMVTWTLSPQNSSTIDFGGQKIWPVSYTALIYRNGSEIYRDDSEYEEHIQSQEVLSEASFFAQVNTSVSNGSISPYPFERKEQGSNFTITYRPNSGYLLQTVRVDGSDVSIASYPDSYTFYNTSGTHTIEAIYVSPSASKSWS